MGNINGGAEAGSSARVKTVRSLVLLFVVFLPLVRCFLLCLFGDIKAGGQIAAAASRRKKKFNRTTFFSQPRAEFVGVLRHAHHKMLLDTASVEGLRSRQMKVKARSSESAFPRALRLLTVSLSSENYNPDGRRFRWLFPTSDMHNYAQNSL